MVARAGAEYTPRPRNRANLHRGMHWLTAVSLARGWAGQDSGVESKKKYGCLRSLPGDEKMLAATDQQW
jgi:hypothetical protein